MKVGEAPGTPPFPSLFPSRVNLYTQSPEPAPKMCFFQNIESFPYFSSHTFRAEWFLLLNLVVAL